MSQVDVDVVDRFLKAFQAGDIETAFSLLHPEVVIHEGDGLPYAGQVRGPRGPAELAGQDVRAPRDASRRLRDHRRRLVGRGGQAGDGVHVPQVRPGDAHARHRALRDQGRARLQDRRLLQGHHERRQPGRRLSRVGEVALVSASWIQ